MLQYLVMDVDGSLTDGKIYMGPNGEAMKAFSIKDGYAVNSILKPNSITPIVLTARNSTIVQNRCEELGIGEIHQGKLDKLSALKDIVGESMLGDCAYFGDDIIDISCMMPIREAGGVIGCPPDAVREVKAVADYICVNKAGEGALREFAEWLVKPRIDPEAVKGRVDQAVRYLKNISVSESDVGKKVTVDENFYYTLQEYMTKPENAVKMESHRKYIDIQIMVRGEERMDIADISRLILKEEYDPEKDVMLWNAPQRMAGITLKEGDCVILYPENAHRGAIMNGSRQQRVLKIVGKVRIE